LTTILQQKFITRSQAFLQNEHFLRPNDGIQCAKSSKVANDIFSGNAFLYQVFTHRCRFIIENATIIAADQQVFYLS